MSEHQMEFNTDRSFTKHEQTHLCLLDIVDQQKDPIGSTKDPDRSKKDQDTSKKTPDSSLKSELSEEEKKKWTNEATKYLERAKAGLDTHGDTEESRTLIRGWHYSSQEDRKHLSEALMDKYGGFRVSAYPEPSILKDKNGNITGLQFDARFLDFHPGPCSIRIQDSNETHNSYGVDEFIRYRGWFGKNEYKVRNHYMMPEFDDTPSFMNYDMRGYYDALKARQAEEAAAKKQQEWMGSGF